MTYPWKHAIVVGASSGMGEQIARQLAAHGCKVALVARRKDELKRIASEINSQTLAISSVPQTSIDLARHSTQTAEVYVHDATDYENVPAIFQTICRELGGLDIIVYAAGVMPRIAPDEYDFAKDRLNVEVNLLGAIAWINEAAVRFGRAGEGTIVGISSVAGDRGRGGQPVYGATKAALNCYLESIRNRIGRLGVAVVTIKPGPVSTPMTKGLTGLPLMIHPQQAATMILDAAARKRNVAYVPGAWAPIMAIIRNVPSFIFRHLKKLNS